MVTNETQYFPDINDREARRNITTGIKKHRKDVQKGKLNCLVYQHFQRTGQTFHSGILNILHQNSLSSQKRRLETYLNY